MGDDSGSVANLTPVNALSTDAEPPTRPSLPITKQEALELYRTQLSPRQRTEISRHRPLDPEDDNKLYFMGLDLQKPMHDTMSDYGDESGRYRFIAHDHLSWRYEMLEVLPFGSGRLFLALDHREGEYVFIKPLRMCKTHFKHSLDMDMKVYDELKDVFDACPPDSLPIVQPIGTFRFRRHDFIVFPAFEMNLSQYLDDMKGQPLEEDAVRQVARCLIDLLRILRAKWFVLGDLSADSIVIKDVNTMRVQVIDCGRAVFPFVGSWRRNVCRQSDISAPEILNDQPFGSSADLYSLGKVLAAMSANHETCRQKSETLTGERGLDGSLRHFIQSCTFPSPDQRWRLGRASNDSWLCKDGWVSWNPDRSWSLTWIPGYLVDAMRAGFSALGSYIGWALGRTPESATNEGDSSQQQITDGADAHTNDKSTADAKIGF